MCQARIQIFKGSKKILSSSFFFPGKGMNEGVVPKGVTPDSDCNSNHPNSASFLSVSSQDVDFVQDNSDYQWFLDYG